jgi:hypothetical protein
MAGGLHTGATIQSIVNKWLFSDDSRTTLGTGLSSARWGLASFSSSSAGYVAGGNTNFTTGRVTTVDKFAFSDDSRTTLGTGLATATANGPAGIDSASAGYVAGGNTGSRVDTVNKFAFSDDSRTTLGTGLSSARDGGVAGFSG